MTGAGAVVEVVDVLEVEDVEPGEVVDVDVDEVDDPDGVVDDEPGVLVEVVDVERDEDGGVGEVESSMRELRSIEVGVGVVVDDESLVGAESSGVSGAAAVPLMGRLVTVEPTRLTAWKVTNVIRAVAATHISVSIHRCMTPVSLL